MLKDLIAQILTDSGTLAPPIKATVDYNCEIVESPTTIKMMVNLSPMDIINLMQKDSIKVESITIGNKEFISPNGVINKKPIKKERNHHEQNDYKNCS